MYCLDSNTVIFFLKGIGNVASTLQSKSRREIAVSAIVVYELETGALKSGNPHKASALLSTFFSEIEILPFEHAHALAAAKIRARLEAEGKPIGPYDLLIAGCAMATNRILVTNNAKEFRRVKGIKTEDWV